MKSRMARYNVSETSLSRSVKNEKLYNQAVDIGVDYIDLSMSKEVDLSYEGNSRSREEYQKYKDLRKERSRERRSYEEESVNERSYDINDILNKAREERLFTDSDNKKRFINTEYNILTKLDLERIEEEKESYKKEKLKNLIDTIYSNDLSNMVNAKKNDDKPLMDDLMPSIEIDEAISKKILDADNKRDLPESKSLDDKKELTALINKTFAQTSDVKSDHEETKEHHLEDTSLLDVEESNKGLIITIVIVTIIVLLVVVGLIVAKSKGAF